MRAADRMPEAREMEMIEEYLEHLRRTSPTGSAEQTVHDRRAILQRLNHDLPFGLGQVSKEELSRWLYRDGWSQNTKATYFRCIKSFYDWAADPADPWISANPAAGMPRIRTADSVARACTDDEMRKILTEAAEPYRTWALLAAYQGLRCIEISRLDREHVTERQLFVVRGKGGRPRVTDTDPIVWATVRDRPPGAIARAPRSGERATAFEVSVRSADHFRRKLGVPTSLHRLRHWFGTTLQREYKDVRVTQVMLGHRSLQSTQIYTAATDEQQRAARSMLPRFS